MCSSADRAGEGGSGRCLSFTPIRDSGTTDKSIIGPVHPFLMTIPDCRIPFVVVALVLVSLVTILPATASLMLSSVSFSPEGPLTPGSQQRLTADFVIIPAGEHTFAPGHNLQLQTNLSGARWVLQVILDGRNAARQEASGSVVFINGEILSYPTDRDVALAVTVDGGVPLDATGSLNVLALEEINNTGDVVPGSALALNQPVAGITLPALTQASPVATSLPAATRTPSGMPGFTLQAALCAIGAALLGGRRALRLKRK
jgi:hypothetical protein